MITVLRTMKCMALLVALWMSPMLIANAPWQLKVERDGIKVYQQQQAGIKLAHSKGVVVVNAQAEQVLQLMQDLSQCNQWLFDCLSAKQYADGLVHMVFKGTMWFKDRDVVFASEIQHLNDSDQWLITTKNQPTKHPNNQFVRVNHKKTTWLITPINHKQVQIDYELYIDPKIRFKSAVNKYNRDAVFTTLQMLRTLLNQQSNEGITAQSNQNQSKL